MSPNVLRILGFFRPQHRPNAAPADACALTSGWESRRPSGISWRRLIHIGHGRRDPDAEESAQVLGYARSECKVSFRPSVIGCIQVGLNQS